MGGTVTLNHSRVTGNSAVAAGGGIASATMDPSSVARLTLNQSSVSDNQQTLDGADGGLGGGGIVNVVGSVSLNKSQVDGNTAEGFVGGGIASGDYFNFSSSNSVLTVNGSEVNATARPTPAAGESRTCSARRSSTTAGSTGTPRSTVAGSRAATETGASRRGPLT
jgi:hypothetical protein